MWEMYSFWTVTYGENCTGLGNVGWMWI